MNNKMRDYEPINEVYLYLSAKDCEKAAKGARHS